MISLHNNVLPWPFIEAIQEFAANEKLALASSTSWERGIVSKGSPVLIKVFPYTLALETLNMLQSKGVFSDVDIDQFAAAHYSWYPGSSIPWHTDEGYLHAMTIYLNHDWDKNWGGYFSYLSEDGVRCIIPEFNLGVAVCPPTPHTVLLVDYSAPVRETLQIFVKPKFS